MKLNITNGEYFNNYIKQKEEGIFIPFNEAMITGPTTEEIFSEIFIKTRLLHHKVTEDYYIKNLYNVNDSNYLHSFKSISLWFGKDSFCQINLLTLLAYLEQINYLGEISLTIVDDVTKEVLELPMHISNKGMLNVYQSVLINKKLCQTQYKYLNNAIKYYLDLYNEKDEISLYIKKNIKNDRESLMIKALELSYEIGLSDSIIDTLINKYQNTTSYHLYYHNILIGELLVNENNSICNYIPHLNNISQLPKNNLLLAFLKNDQHDVLSNLPFFESRIQRMIHFKINEIQYPNDYYLLKKN